jgi:hypothetical protein
MELTANDMKFNFQLKFNSLFEFSAPSYDDRQISYLLTEAQFRVFLKRYNPLGNKYQKGFEADEQRRRDLEQLLVPGLYDLSGAQSEGVEEITKSSNQGGVHPNGVFFDLPSGFLYSVEESVKLMIIESESWVKPVRHDEYLANINNPYKKPYENLIWRMDISRHTHGEGVDFSTQTPKRTELIAPEGFTIERYRIRYLSSPPEIICNEFNPSEQKHCILDGSIHGDIIDEAVSMANAAVSPEEYKIGLSEKERSN